MASESTIKRIPLRRVWISVSVDERQLKVLRVRADNHLHLNSNDAGPYALRGTPYSCVFYDAPKVGSGGFHFDGVNDYVRVENDTSLFNLLNMSVSVWLQPHSYGGSPGYQVVLSKESDSLGRNYLVNLDSSGLQASSLRSHAEAA